MFLQKLKENAVGAALLSSWVLVMAIMYYTAYTKPPAEIGFTSAPTAALAMAAGQRGYTLTKVSLPNPNAAAFIAPCHYDGKSLLFTRGEAKYCSIVEYDMETKQYSSVYQSDVGTVIGTPLCIKDVFYWVEYNPEMTENLPWKIVSMDRRDKKPVVVRTGYCNGELQPPILSAYGTVLTWIEKTVVNGRVYCNAYVKAYGKEEKGLVTGVLDEAGGADNRAGDYFIAQFPTPQGLLVQTSSFRNGVRSMKLVSHSYEDGYLDVLYTGDDMMEFTANGEYYVITKADRVLVYSMRSKELLYDIPSGDRRTNNDMPYIWGDHLFYRHGANQIIDVSLRDGSKTVVKQSKDIPPKLFALNNFLGFTVNSAAHGDGSVELYILQ